MAIQTTDTLILDIKKTVVQTVRAKQYDNNSRVVKLKLVDNDEQIMLNDYRLMIKAHTSKGRSLLYNCEALSDGTAALVLNQDILYDSGTTNVELIVIGDDDYVISSTQFVLQVLPSVFSDEEIIDDPEFDILLKTLEEVKEALDEVSSYEEAENQRKANELVRTTNEQQRVSNESSRTSAETLRLTNETTRETNESARVSAENTRISNETTRQSNEVDRASAENQRLSSEDTRVSNETTRQSNESSRLIEEITRVSNEQTRIANENARLESESDRESAEELRISAENARTSAESTRISKESVRVSNEIERLEAESDRSDAEDVRVANENTRISNENTRVVNESTRQTNETTRISNENQRQVSINTALSDANEALTNATSALSSADEAIISANTASATAQRAATDATNALDSVAEMEDTLEDLINADNLVRTDQLGVPDGVATLDSAGLIPSYQLPSYVDDVLEGDAQNVQDTPTGGKTATAFILTGETDPVTPESGKIYMDVTSNICFRWTGTIFAAATAGLTLGTTSSTAFPGDRGLTAETLATSSVYDVVENDGIVTVYKNDNTSHTFIVYDEDSAPIPDDENENVTFTGTEDSGFIPDGNTLVNNSGILSVKINPNNCIKLSGTGVFIDTDNSLKINTSKQLSINYDNSSIILDSSGKLCVNEFYGTEDEVMSAMLSGDIPEGAIVYITDDD